MIIRTAWLAGLIEKQLFETLDALLISHLVRATLCMVRAELLGSLGSFRFRFRSWSVHGTVRKCSAHFAFVAGGSVIFFGRFARPR